MDIKKFNNINENIRTVRISLNYKQSTIYLEYKHKLYNKIIDSIIFYYYSGINKEERLKNIPDNFKIKYTKYDNLVSYDIKNIDVTYELNNYLQNIVVNIINNIKYHELIKLIEENKIMNDYHIYPYFNNIKYENLETYENEVKDQYRLYNKQCDNINIKKLNIFLMTLNRFSNMEKLVKLLNINKEPIYLKNKLFYLKHINNNYYYYNYCYNYKHAIIYEHICDIYINEGYNDTLKKIDKKFLCGLDILGDNLLHI